MSAREIEQTKDRARRVASAKRRDALNITMLPPQPQSSAPGPAAPVLAVPVQCSYISIVSEIVAHPTVHHLQVGSDVQVTEAVPAEFAQYIRVVGMIRKKFVCRVNTNWFLAYILCFNGNACQIFPRGMQGADQARSPSNAAHRDGNLHETIHHGERSFEHW